MVGNDTQLKIFTECEKSAKQLRWQAVTSSGRPGVTRMHRIPHEYLPSCYTVYTIHPSSPLPTPPPLYLLGYTTREVLLINVHRQRRSYSKIRPG